MADTPAAAPAAPKSPAKKAKTPKAPKEKKPKAPKVAPKHPGFNAMVVEAIAALKERTGSSLAGTCKASASASHSKQRIPYAVKCVKSHRQRAKRECGTHACHLTCHPSRVS